MARARSWAEMKEWMAGLVARSGADVAEWNRRIDAAGITDEPALRAFLDEQGVTGYAQMLLVFERFGYPDFFTRTGEELIDAQYADRTHLRPVYDAVELLALGLAGTHVQARKGYVSFVGPRRTFAAVQPSTRARVDLGLRLDDPPGGRLATAPSVGNAAIRVRVPLGSVEDVDDEVADLVRRAYAENL
ncbi:DUF5655 domain-containing protein [Georgenia thermotolerans]|uniref:DUF5655 domain-containing protein n=1 Tax=Georgenia thermotolerans TaxID=527326 RepID=A0A7J5USK1_9MICO|nr:DUF5655 domain-containing protein [Georgenia thermotolerans]KAE8765432.1 hypothetical protein GB883_03945 [Georgenia thermotolerans]